MSERYRRLQELLAKPLVGYELEGSGVCDNLTNLRDAITLALADEQTPPSNAAVFKMIYRMTSEPIDLGDPERSAIEPGTWM